MALPNQSPSASKPRSYAMPTYEQVQCHLLNESDRPFSTQEPQLPLVLQSCGHTSLGFLQEFLRGNSYSVRSHIDTFGAVLLRGFDIHTAQDYQAAMSSLKGITPMNDYLMSEPGRKLVPNTDFVFNTNSIKHTGGGFVFGVFHSENYHSPDVPGLVSFCPLKKSWLGSEIGLTHMANGYSELPQDLRHKLGQQAYCAGVWPLRAVAKQHRLALSEAETLCLDKGLTIKEHFGNKYVVLYKPSIYRHPLTGQPSFQINLFNTIGRFKQEILNQFMPCYQSWHWLLHRLAWRLNLDEIMMPLFTAPRQLMRPQVARRIFDYLLPSSAKKQKSNSGLFARLSKLVKHNSVQEMLQVLDLTSLDDVITDNEVRQIAKVVCDHTSVFHWQPGDILLIDNYQLLHAAMPGLGPRDILASFYNPIPLVFDATAGVSVYREDLVRKKRPA